MAAALEGRRAAASALAPVTAGNGQSPHGRWTIFCGVEAVSGLTRDVLDRARRSRDARFDGRFFIAVRSTRIYCRPICPSRFSDDSNVRYYATAAEAAAAGYRPCLRCRPEAAPGSPGWAGTSAVVQRALRLIQEGALNQGSVGSLAERLGIGIRHLNRLFTKHVGVSPAIVAYTQRAHFAKRLLDETDLSITDIALAAGFGSIRRFNDAFRATYGRSPRELRRGRRVRADAQIELRLSYRPPYDWLQIHSFLARRIIQGVECADNAGYTRAVRTTAGHAVLQIFPVAGHNALALRIHGAAPADLPGLVCAVRRMFDLGADPERINATLANDALLRNLVARRPGLRIPGDWDAFECAIRALVGERRSAAASAALLTHLTQRLGTPISSPLPGITHLFPTPGALAEGDLALAGLSKTLRGALQSLARSFCRQEIPASAGHTEGTQRLPRLAEWLVGYIELRGLGEPDALPARDLILRRQLAVNGHALTPMQLEVRAERWRPFRGYGVVHLWTAAQR